MCGIVGVLSRLPPATAIVEQMRDRLAHRGPDGAGLWRSDDGRVCLAHRRLAIVDLSPEAAQPFVSDDGRFVLVFNGEIYNFRTLRRELEARGRSFRTRSDSEVLLEAFHVWGSECLDELSGMFAFAIWDGDRRRLFCARDRGGEKPFHYAVVEGSFVFASELKSLLLWPGFRRSLDHTALLDFLSFGCIPDPKTIWEGARKLPPAHWLTVEFARDGRVEVGPPTPYWDLEFAPDESVRDWDGAVREAVTSAAKEMSYADVPVGAFLSGGVDSSSVTAALRRNGSDVSTFTVGFAEADYDERPFAADVAALYGTRHTEREVHANDVADVFRDTILWHYDEPFNDSSYLPTFYVCREARKTITVALSGDGGDEAFAGYRKYRRLALRQQLESILPAPARRCMIDALLLVPSESSLRERLLPYRSPAPDLLVEMMITGISPPLLQSIARGALADAARDYCPTELPRALLEKAPPEEVGLVNAMRYLDLKLTLAAGILVKVDRASMAVSLEVRPVYLNRGVLELAGRIPPRLLADRLQTKKVLKSAFRPWLPPQLLEREKMGFAMPLSRWLRTDLRSLLSRVTEEDRPLSGLLDRRFVKDVVERHASGAADLTAVAHSLVFLDHWLERWA